MSLSPLTRRRLASFRASRRGYWALWIFLTLFVLSLGADFLANDRPLLVRHDGRFYVPVLRAYPETAFGGELLIEVIFSLNGLGLLGFEAAVNRDYPVMFGTLYLYTLIGLLLNIVTDLTYTVIDPRIDFERRDT